MANTWHENQIRHPDGLTCEEVEYDREQSLKIKQGYSELLLAADKVLDALDYLRVLDALDYLGIALYNTRNLE